MYGCTMGEPGRVRMEQEQGTDVELTRCYPKLQTPRWTMKPLLGARVQVTLH